MSVGWHTRMAALPAHVGSAILIVDHGSRRTKANQDITEIGNAVRELLRQEGDPAHNRVRVAHMSEAGPTISETVKKLIEKDKATSIDVLPYFLTNGTHTKYTIPKLLKQATSGTKCDFRIAEALGPDPLLANLLLKKASVTSTAKEQSPILIVDHGSMTPGTEKGLFAITELVRRILPRRRAVALAHMELQRPSILESVSKLKKRQPTVKAIKILPYFLGRGRHLTQDIPQLVRDACEKNSILSYSIGNALGPDPRIASLLLQRRNQMYETNKSNGLLENIKNIQRKLRLHESGIVAAAACSNNSGYHAMVSQWANRQPQLLQSGGGIGSKQRLWKKEHGKPSAYPQKQSNYDILKRVVAELTSTTTDRLAVASSLASVIIAKKVSVSSASVFKSAMECAKHNPSQAFIELQKYTAMKLTQSILQEVKEMLFTPLQQKVRRSISTAGYHKIQSLSHESLNNRSHGSLTRILQRGDRALDRVPSVVVFQFIPTLAELVMVSSTLNSISSKLAITNLLMATSYCLWSIPSTNLRASYKRLMTHSEDLLAVKATDALQNHELVSLEQQVSSEKDKYASAQLSYSNAAVRHQRMLSLIKIGQQAIFSISISSVVAVALQGMSKGTMTISDLILAKTLMFQLARPMELLGAYYRELQAGLGDLNQLFRFLLSTETVIPLRHLEHPLSGNISLRDVTFTHSGTNKGIHSVNLEIKKGQKIAIVGRSGSGKSTLVKVISGLFQADKGKVLIGKKQKQLSVVSQGTPLLRDTVAANVRYGDKCNYLSDVKIAAMLASIGFFKPLSSPAKDLSGGERQRVALARALLKNSPIIVLDEATSALDRFSSTSVMKRIRESLSTVVVVSHSLSNPTSYDRIIVLDRGTVAADGDHKTLMKSSELYQRLQTHSGI